MNICRKKFPLSKSVPSNGLSPNSQWCNTKPSFCCASFVLALHSFPLRPQVFEERSLSQGGGGLPLRHWHWPLRESHRSPGQHCCISAQRPGGSAYHRRSGRFVTPITAGRVYEQSPSAASPGPRVISCNISRIEKISSVRGAERVRGGEKAGTINSVRRLFHSIFWVS